MAKEKPMNVGGRPRLGGESVLKVVAVKLLPEQRAVIERLAGEQHTTMSEVVRSLLSERLAQLAEGDEGGER
jgi:hypothetical protein